MCIQTCPSETSGVLGLKKDYVCHGGRVHVFKKLGMDRNVWNCKTRMLSRSILFMTRFLAIQNISRKKQPLILSIFISEMSWFSVHVFCTRVISWRDGVLMLNEFPPRSLSPPLAPNCPLSYSRAVSDQFRMRSKMEQFSAHQKCWHSNYTELKHPAFRFPSFRPPRSEKGPNRVNRAVLTEA